MDYRLFCVDAHNEAIVGRPQNALDFAIYLESVNDGKFFCIIDLFKRYVLNELTNRSLSFVIAR